METARVEYGELDETVHANTPYRVTSVSLMIEGVCPGCQKAG